MNPIQRILIIMCILGFIALLVALATAMATYLERIPQRFQKRVDRILAVMISIGFAAWILHIVF